MNPDIQNIGFDNRPNATVDLPIAKQRTAAKKRFHAVRRIQFLKKFIAAVLGAAIAICGVNNSSGSGPNSGAQVSSTANSQVQHEASVPPKIPGNQASAPSQK